MTSVETFGDGLNVATAIFGVFFTLYGLVTLLTGTPLFIPRRFTRDEARLFGAFDVVFGIGLFFSSLMGLRVI
jgi:hypothetical protein